MSELETANAENATATPVENPEKSEKAEKVETTAKAKKKKKDAPAEEPVFEIEETLSEIPETIEVPTREGYKITGRKPTYGDRQWVFAQPEGMQIPEGEILPAACITSIQKAKRDEKGKLVKDENGQPIWEAVPLHEGVHPWFRFDQMGLEGPVVYMNFWNRTYNLTNPELAKGILYATREMKLGNA